VFISCRLLTAGARADKPKAAKKASKKTVRKAAKKAPAKVSKKTAASQKLQGQYLSLIGRIPKGQRAKFKAIVAKEGREAAIAAMQAALNKK
jgi:hypothetical protein